MKQKFVQHDSMRLSQNLNHNQWSQINRSIQNQQSPGFPGTESSIENSTGLSTGRAKMVYFSTFQNKQKDKVNLQFLSKKMQQLQQIMDSNAQTSPVGSQNSDRPLSVSSANRSNQYDEVGSGRVASPALQSTLPQHEVTSGNQSQESRSKFVKVDKNESLSLPEQQSSKQRKPQSQQRSRRQKVRQLSFGKQSLKPSLIGVPVKIPTAFMDRTETLKGTQEF